MDERATVEAARRGDGEAFGVLVRRYQHALVAGARVMTRSAEDAEDLAQEAFISAYRQLPTLRDPEKFRAWLFGILRHKCLNHLGRHASPGLPLEDAEAEVAVAFPEDQAMLASLLEMLPLVDREMLVARYLHGLEYREIAEALRTSETAVRMRCSRARARLRARLDEVDDARLAQALAPLLIFPLDSFADGVLSEVSTMSQLASTAPCAAATATAVNFSLPALCAGAVGKAMAVVAVVAALSGGYLFAGAKGLVPLPPVVAGAVGVASAADAEGLPPTVSPVAATVHAPGSSEEKLQHVLDVTLQWIEANDGRLPVYKQWPTQIGLTEADILSPDGEWRYMLNVFGNGQITTIAEVHTYYDQLSDNEKAQVQQLFQGRIPLVFDAPGPNAKRSAVVPRDQVLFGFLDGTVGAVDMSVPGANAIETQCRANIKQLALVTIMLADDIGERFPTVEQWEKYRSSIFVQQKQKVLMCPTHGGVDSYAYNHAAAGISVATVREPDKLVLFYEVRDGQPDFRHDGKMQVAFADGHVELVTPERFRALGVK